MAKKRPIKCRDCEKSHSIFAPTQSRHFLINNRLVLRLTIDNILEAGGDTLVRKKS